MGHNDAFSHKFIQRLLCKFIRAFIRVISVNLGDQEDPIFVLNGSQQVQELRDDLEALIKEHEIG